MKIGILTFHWATNYGAVLQAFCLQEYLKERGHDVEIINYKPRHFDFGWNYLRRPWLLRRLRKDLLTQQREKKLISFRNTRLNLSSRFFSTKDLLLAKVDYDVVISGSDQILNPSFTLSGENRPTSAYFLSFATKSKRIGYAVSFGCTDYSSDALNYAKKWIGYFDAVGAREDTGIQILTQMNYQGEKQVVPDPTILYGKGLFNRINIPGPRRGDYLCVYVLRDTFLIEEDNAVYIDELNNPVSLEDWLGLIINSRGLITNSYHGMIMSILNHVPFVTLKSKADNAGMNDRFSTLLSRLQLHDRLVDSIDSYKYILSKPISWEDVDRRIDAFRKEGASFLEEVLK